MPHADDRRQAEVGAEAAKRKERDIPPQTSEAGFLRRSQMKEEEARWRRALQDCSSVHSMATTPVPSVHSAKGKSFNCRGGGYAGIAGTELCA